MKTYFTRNSGQKPSFFPTFRADAFLACDLQACKDQGFTIVGGSDWFTATNPETGLSVTCGILAG